MMTQFRQDSRFVMTRVFREFTSFERDLKVEVSADKSCDSVSLVVLT